MSSPERRQYVTFCLSLFYHAMIGDVSEGDCSTAESWTTGQLEQAVGKEHEKDVFFCNKSLQFDVEMCLDYFD